MNTTYTPRDLSSHTITERELSSSPDALGEVFFDTCDPDIQQNIQNNIEGPTAASLKIDSTVVALSMQYNSDGSINTQFLSDQLHSLFQQGIRTVLIAGTTGESSLLEKNEHITYIRLACLIAQKLGVTIIGGTGSNSTSEQNQLTTDIFLGSTPLLDTNLIEKSGEASATILNAGAVASLLLYPYYIKTSYINLIRHFTQALNIGPGIIYSIAGRTKEPIPIEIIKILSTHPNFIGVKECDGAERIKQLQEYGITVWTGNDDTMYEDIHQHGAYGTISVTAGLIADEVLGIVSGNTSQKQVDTNYTLSQGLFMPGVPNPTPIHSAWSMKKRAEGATDTPTFRLPVGPLSTSQQQYLADIMHIIGLNAHVYGSSYPVES